MPCRIRRRVVEKPATEPEEDVSLESILEDLKRREGRTE